jgi:hypothetical protein
VNSAVSGHRRHMRVVLPVLFVAASWGGDVFGVWKLNLQRSTIAVGQKTVSVRIDPHTRGEVFTLKTVTPDGRTSTSSTILYLDGKAREFQDATCSGTQSSRLLDGRTVEIARECAGGGKVRLLRKSVNAEVLILEISELYLDGSRSDQRLVLEKH